MSQRLYTERGSTYVSITLDDDADYTLDASTSSVDLWHHGSCHSFTWQEWDTITAALNEQRLYKEEK